MGAWQRAVAEPDHMLTAGELEQRVCADYRCMSEAHLSISEKVA
jgi:hypothetical protein